MAEGNVSKLPLTAQLGISIALAAVIGGLFYWQVYQGMLEEETQKKTHLADLQKQIQALEVTAARLQDFQRELAYFERRLEAVKLRLPPEKEAPDLIRKISNLTSESSLRTSVFQPGATVQRDFYQEWPVSISVDGTYHNLGAFFDRINRLPRLVNASGIKISALGTQTSFKTITASFSATTYVYSYQEPPAGAPAQRK